VEAGSPARLWETRDALKKAVLMWIVTALAPGAVAADARTGKPASPKDARTAFVLDVVRTAVALPQPDPQDRLRVLHSAVGVVGPISANIARTLSREGVQLESELIRSGQKPAVSMFSAGHVPCTAAANFVQSLPATAVAEGEEALISAVTLCPKAALENARGKLDEALGQDILAARALLAAMDATGPKMAWSQSAFVRMFSALPKDAAKAQSEAPNFAAMYSEMAPQVDLEAARAAGLRMLEWLGRVPEGGPRNLAISIMKGAMEQLLGAEKLEEALRSNVVAQGVVRNAGEAGEIEHPEEENVSVLEAMDKTGSDQTDSLQALPASRRAREAAAHGFASGTAGNRNQAEHYFDIAFSALNDYWRDRATNTNAAAVVEEVSEAAAQVDAPAALSRAQRLADPTAQAIGMLAVARVVAGQ